MNCPYCNEQMEPGYIFTSADSGLIWLPDDKKINPLRMWSKETLETKKGILFSKSMSYKKIIACICRKCNKCIFDF